MTKHKQVTAGHMGEYLWICLDSKWQDLFGKLPTFTYRVVDNRLQIISEEIRLGSA